MRIVRLGRWTLVVSAAALGAATLAAGEGVRLSATTNPYEQVIGTAVIDSASPGKPFDVRGEALQREAGRFTLTLVRTADSATGALKAGVFSGAHMKVTIKLNSGTSYFINGVQVLSDSVGMLGGVNGAALEQVVFSK